MTPWSAAGFCWMLPSAACWLCLGVLAFTTTHEPSRRMPLASSTRRNGEVLQCSAFCTIWALGAVLISHAACCVGFSMCLEAMPQ